MTGADHRRQRPLARGSVVAFAARPLATPFSPSETARLDYILLMEFFYPSDLTVIYTTWPFFRNSLAVWEASPQRAWWLEAAQGSVEEKRRERRTGIEGWFDEPASVESLSAEVERLKAFRKLVESDR